MHHPRGLLLRGDRTWHRRSASQLVVNLGFVAIGLLVLADAGRRRRGTSRMVIDDRYVVLYGAVGIFLGLGSFAFHGSLRAWGGYVDVISMHAFLAFILAYDLARIHDKPWRWFAVGSAAS